jgi:hypothetical protein
MQQQLQAALSMMKGFTRLTAKDRQVHRDAAQELVLVQLEIRLWVSRARLLEGKVTINASILRSLRYARGIAATHN